MSTPYCTIVILLSVSTEMRFHLLPTWTVKVVHLFVPQLKLILVYGMIVLQ